MPQNPTDSRDRLRAAGLGLSALVALPVLIQGGIDSPRLVPWLLAHGVFAAAFVATASGRGRSWLLGVQVLALLTIVLLMCDGFEGALLALVAFEAGTRFRLSRAIAFVVTASLLLGIAVGYHWSPRPALLLTPPYLGFQLLAVVVARMLEESAAQRRDLAEANDELRAAGDLAAENSRLAERVRIARELHDAVGHQLTALRLNLDVAARFVEGRAEEPLAVAQALAKRALDDVRDVVAELRDERRIDLATALQAMAAEIPRPRVHVSVEAPLPVPGPGQALTLLRCAQEIVTNAARHASAENLWIEVVTRGRLLELRARDDGVGSVNVPAGGGIDGLRARLALAGGNLEVSSVDGGGVTVRASVPSEAPT